MVNRLGYDRRVPTIEERETFQAPQSDVDGGLCTPHDLMVAAIAEMRFSKSEGGKPTPMVGAVACFPDGTVVRAHRSEFRNGDHAEYTLFERKLRTRMLDDAKLFVTLEPCAPGARSGDKVGCAKRIVDARVKEVWIGCQDPHPSVDGQGRAYLEANGVTVHEFDDGMCDQIRAEDPEFFKWAEEAERTAAAGPGLVETVKHLLDDPKGRIALSEAIAAEVDALRLRLEGPLPTSMTEPEEFARWLDELTAIAAPTVRAYATVGYWGNPDQVAPLVKGLERLTRWSIAGGIVILLNARLYPPLMALYGAGVAAVAADNYGVVARLLRSRVPRSAVPYAQPDQDIPLPLALNGPEVLDRVEMNAVLNIGVEQPIRYIAPESVYIQRELKPLVADLIRDDAAYEGAFDTFECLLGLRYILDGGPGLPTGSYSYRGRRSFTMRGVPERLLAELERDGASWPPIAGGVFDGVEDAARALEAMVQRLAASSWTAFS